MDDGMVAFLVSVTLAFLYVVLAFGITATPQELDGYEIQITELQKGEVIKISALSPNINQAAVEMALDSENIFLLTGDPEIVAPESQRGFSLEISTGLGEWEVHRGYELDLDIYSDTALHVEVTRSGEYHFATLFWVFIAFLLIWIFLMWMIL